MVNRARKINSIHGEYSENSLKSILKCNQITLGRGLELILFDGYSVQRLYVHFLN